MKIVLAYSGSPRSTAELSSLIAQGHEVVTVTVDVGQSEPLDGIRARALGAGALRAHVIDGREAFVRTCVFPAMQASPAPDLATLARPLIVKTVAEVAGIEGPDAAPRVPAPSGAADPRERHLLIRPSLNPSKAPDGEARLDISLEHGVPVAVNDVPMTPVELIESLSLIAGQHGIGHDDAVPAPAAVVLRAVHASAPGPSATVRLTLHKGTYVVQGAVEAVTVSPS